MIRLLAISGSPVKGSSTDLLLLHLLSAIRDALPDDAPITESFVRLNDLKFIPCQSCGVAPTSGFCIYDDDLTEVYTQLSECDCLLFGTPIYFDTVSAQAKAFIDRCNCFRPADFGKTNPSHSFIKLIHRKRPGAMVLVGGERGWFEGARRVVAGFFKWVEVTNEGKIVHHSDDFSLKGTAAANQTVLAEASALGHRLAAIIAESHG